MKININLITPSQFRANIYKYLDEVAKKGKTLEINRDGVILQIVPKKQAKQVQIMNDISRLKKRKALLCSDEELLNISWEKEWNPGPL
ncbi:MAG: type II toxin-antitoxin system Phd/YefM family antitoxin [Deltaproteobacteria bacterium]|nr:type II toxin-antitoxin system Phd/YefM family antitoxin [Deltaproteobacteria bacterium]